MRITLMRITCSFFIGLIILGSAERVDSAERLEIELSRPVVFPAPGIAPDQPLLRRKTKAATKPTKRKVTSTAAQVKLQPGQFLIETTNGSRMIGRVVGINAISLKVSHGTIEIPVKQISSIVRVKDSKEFRIYFASGVLTGELTIAEIKYDTEFGQLIVTREKFAKLTMASTPINTAKKIPIRLSKEMIALKKQLATVEGFMQVTKKIKRYEIKPVGSAAVRIMAGTQTWVDHRKQRDLILKQIEDLKRIEAARRN